MNVKRCQNVFERIYNSIYLTQISVSALVGSLAMGTTFIMSPIAGILTDIIGIRTTTLIGGLLATTGFYLSSFVTHSFEALCITYGIMFGFGAALSYTPSLAILGHYFRKYLGIVNGIVTSGSSVFTIILPYVISFCLNRIGLAWTLRVMTICALGFVFGGILFKPAFKKPKNTEQNIKAASHTKLLYNKKYILWIVFTGTSQFGYYVAYVHMIKFVQDNFDEQTDAKLPVLCIGIASGIARLIIGYLADNPNISRIMLQQISFLVLSAVTFMIPLTKGAFPALLVISLIIGACDGCFVSMVGPIAFDICGPERASLGIGFLMGICSIPLTIGPYIAGKLYDQSGNYDLAFMLSGIPPLLAGLLMTILYYIKTNDYKSFECEGGDDEPNNIMQNYDYKNIDNSPYQQTIPLNKNKIIDYEHYKLNKSKKGDNRFLFNSQSLKSTEYKLLNFDSIPCEAHSFDSNLRNKRCYSYSIL